MANNFWQWFHYFILFGRNTVGCINSPYITYRKLAREDTPISQIIFIFLLVFFYFFFTSTIRVGIRYPFLLTLKFNLLVLGTTSGFFGMVFLIFILGKFFSGTGNIRSVFILWSYTLLPTLVWFLATSFLYVLIPPPRTLSLLGKMYSLVFVCFSIAVFFWKLILYYLTLRQGMRLDLLRIVGISTLLAPIIIGYSLMMYRWGIFRVPFL